jgi:hypothetical protein
MMLYPSRRIIVVTSAKGSSDSEMKALAFGDSIGEFEAISGGERRYRKRRRDGVKIVEILT